MPAPLVFGAHAEAGRTSEPGDGGDRDARVVELLGLRLRPPVCLQLLGRLRSSCSRIRVLNSAMVCAACALLRLGIAHDRVGSSPPCVVVFGQWSGAARNWAALATPPGPARTYGISGGIASGQTGQVIYMTEARTLTPVSARSKPPAATPRSTSFLLV